MSRPTASPNRWPYREHRTVEQVDRHEAATKGLRDERRGRLDIKDTKDGSARLLAAIQREKTA